MAYFFANTDELLAVFSRLLSNPLFILKPVSTWKDPDPLYFQIFLLILVTSYTYYKTVSTSNCSCIDRIWSIAPTIYSLSMLLHYFYHHDKVLHTRLSLMFLLIFGWGIRLTYNLYIKGGYKNDKEDHRWRLIRTWFVGKQLKWNLFVLFFINIYLSLSIFLFSSLPLYIIYNGPQKMNLYDLPLTILFSFFLIIETFADDQMFAFQELKKQSIRKRDFSQKGDDKFIDGYYSNGLYKYSRHPNYFGELGQWLMIYLLSSNTSSITFANWTMIGYLNLCAIFYKSMNLTEGITTFKYPKYKYYAKRTSRLIPWFPTPEKKKSN